MNPRHGRLSPGASRPTRIPRAALIDFLFYLEHLLAAGVPLQEGLQDLAQDFPVGTMRESTGQLAFAIAQGLSLSAALAALAPAFPPLLVQLVRAGETSGQLVPVLRRARADLQWQDQQLATLRQIALYPALAGVALSAAMVFLLAYVVPQLVAFLQRLQRPLPWQTRLLIETSQALLAHWPWLLALPAVAVLGVLVLRRTVQAFALWWDGWLLGAPVLGSLLVKLQVMRTCHLLALGYASGLELLECLRLAAAASGNRCYAAGLRVAAAEVSYGNSLSASLSELPFLPNRLIRMLRVGEATGGLEAALSNVGEVLARELATRTSQLQALLMPALVCLLGVLLLWIVAAVFGPLYDLFATLHV